MSFRSGHDSVLENRADGLHVPRESLLVTTVDLSDIFGCSGDDPISTSGDGEYSPVLAPSSESIPEGSIGALCRLRLLIFSLLFCKKRALLHNFLKYVISLGFRQNGVISFELYNANVRYWEGKRRVPWGGSTVAGKRRAVFGWSGEYLRNIGAPPNHR